MISIPHKAKQFLLVIIKLLIVSTALSYIYNQLQNKKVDWNSISTYLSFQSILILILFSATNWILEIFKWQNLVSFFKKISFLESTKQSLGSLTASIFTPNRIGEYGAKMLYYPKENAKKIVFLNFISNSSQMAVTCFFGILGLIINSSKFDSLSLWISFKMKLLFLILIIVVVFVFLFFCQKT